MPAAQGKTRGSSKLRRPVRKTAKRATSNLKLQQKQRKSSKETAQKDLSSFTGLLVRFYEKAEKRSRSSGRSESFVVKVVPGKTPQITLIETDAREVETARDGQDELERALAAARERGRTTAGEILSAPTMLSADKFASLIGTTRETVNVKRQKHQLLALDGSKRGYRFPDWQLDENGKPFTIFPQLFEHLGKSSWAVYRFLVQSHPELNGESGLDALRRGRDKEVLKVAESAVRDFT